MIYQHTLDSFDHYENRFTVAVDSEINISLIGKQIKKHLNTRVSHYKKMKRYYDGLHDIYNERNSKDWHNDRRVAVNFCKNIINTKNGYFVGIKPIVKINDDKLKEMIELIDDDNDFSAKISTHAQNAAVYGVSYELTYTWQNPITKKGETRYCVLEPKNTFVVYDDTIEPEVKYGVYLTPIQNSLENVGFTESKFNVCIYTSKAIYKGIYSNGSLILNQDVQEHFYGMCPISVFYNFENKTDLSSIIALQDAYNLVESNEITDIELFNDPLLLFKNLDLKADDIIAILRNRIVMTKTTTTKKRDFDDGGSPVESEMKWLDKPNNYQRVESALSRLRSEIHMTAMIPDLSDKDFISNLSGVAIRYKMTGMEQLVANVQSNFERALKRRYELIVNYLNLHGHNFDSRKIKFVFTRNHPMNDKEEIEKLLSLYKEGAISLKSLLELVPYVKDPDKEYELIKEETGVSSDDIQKYLDAAS